MSFSSEIKSELCLLSPTPCCRKAEAFGLLIFGRAFSVSEISMMTELECVAVRYCNLLRELTGIVPVIRFTKAGNYKVRVETAADRLKVLDFFGYSGSEIALRVNFSNFENTEEDCCFRSFLRGAFLICGNITNPEKEYHLEFSVSRAKLCADLMKVVDEDDLKAKKLTRGGSYVIYCKEAEAIEDFLGKMGATKAFLYMMKMRAMKDIKNITNRRANFESANLSRSVLAGMRQTELIESILAKIKTTDMTEDLGQLCTLRLDNPDASLDELGRMMSPPLSRSAVSRRFKKLEEIAKELKK